MLYFKVACCLFVTCLLVHDGWGQTNLMGSRQRQRARMQERLQALANSTSQFGFALFRSLSPTADIICSPMSVYRGLSLMLMGVSGSTKSETRTTLRQKKRQGVHRTLRALMKSLPRPGETQNMLRVAESLYYSGNYQMKTKFQSESRVYGRDALRQFAFPNPETEISSWVSNMTEGNIPNFMPSNTLPDDLPLLLVSGFFFQGSWTFSFTSRDVSLGQFTPPSGGPVSITQLNIVASYALQSLGPSLEAQILEMPYEDGRMSLYIVLPDDVGGLPALESKLDDQILENALRKAVPKQLVDVKLPAFKLKMRASLKPMLQDMGITKLFNQSSDFQRLSSDAVYLYDVWHYAFLEVAAAGPFPGPNSTPQTPTAAPRSTFHALHPFLVVLRDNKANTNLLLGRVNNPRTSMQVE